jgi:hypothetical protein
MADGQRGSGGEVLNDGGISAVCSAATVPKWQVTLPCATQARLAAACSVIA